MRLQGTGAAPAEAAKRGPSYYEKRYSYEQQMLVGRGGRGANGGVMELGRGCAWSFYSALLVCLVPF